MERLVLAYSGSPDSSLAISWLKSTYQADVIAVTLDLGQGRDVEAIRDRALALGAARAHVVDRREEFARDVVLPSLVADALHDDRVPLVAALSRPILARALLEIADSEKAGAIAHAGSGRRGTLDVLLRALRPKLKIIAPRREWALTPEARSAEAQRLGVAPAPGACTAEVNIWGRVFQCPLPVGDDAAASLARTGGFTLTRAPQATPDEAAQVTIAFERGVPTAINRVALPLAELIETLTTVASVHGIGRFEPAEARVGGVAVLEGIEAPAAVLLHAAHRELRRATAARDFDRFSSTVSAAYAEIIAAGQWYSPLRTALAAYADAAQARITGAVGFQLHRGVHSIVDRTVRPASSRRSAAAVLPMTAV